MSDGPFQGNGDDLHVLMGMKIEARSAFDHIVIENT